MGCAFLSGSSIFEFLANFWKFLDRDLYICYTLHYTFERTVRHSVFVAQWLERRTGMREVPSSIPLDVTSIVSSFYFLWWSRFNYINLLLLNLRSLARDLRICSTLHCALECTSRHSVCVAQWLTQWTYMREVPGSIPIDVLCLFHHCFSYGEVANSSLFAIF